MDTNMFEEQEYTKKIDFSLWKKLLNYAKPHRKQLTVLIVTMVLMATTDALLPLMTRYAVDSFIVEKTTGGLVLFAAVYVGIGLVQAT